MDLGFWGGFGILGGDKEGIWGLGGEIWGMGDFGGNFGRFGTGVGGFGVTEYGGPEHPITFTWDSCSPQFPIGSQGPHNSYIGVLSTP